MIAGTNLLQQWDDLKSKTLEGLKAHFPIETRTRSVVLHDLHIDESKVADGDIKSQEIAKQNDGTWGARVLGDISIVDKQSGKVIDRAKVKLLSLPKPTERFTFIVGGNEVQTHHLWKLKSGVYAHVQQNGEMKTEFNLAKGFAGSPRLNIPFDPKTLSFKLSYGDTNVNLYPILKVLGVDDSDMKREWGDEIFKHNVVKDPQKVVLKLYGRLKTKGLPKDVTPEQAAKALIEEFGKTKLLPETTKAVFGKPIESVTGEALLLGSRRILEVARGNIPPDNRDALIFKSLHGPDDYVHSYLTRPATKMQVKGKIIGALGKYERVSDVVGGGLFQDPIDTFFHRSSLAVNPEQTNPVETMTNFRSTTTLGGDVGGIKEERALTRPMKLIDPTHMGFLDPIHTPEGGRTGITLRLPLAAKKVGHEIKIPVYDLKQKKSVYVGTAELHSEHVVFPDQVTWGSDQKPKPISANIKMKDPKSHETVVKPFTDGRYVIMSPIQMFDEATNLIPFLQNNQGNRASMAAKIMEQAISLHGREEPLVRVGTTGGGPTLERVFGLPWTRRAPTDGTITKVVNSQHNGYPEELHIKGSDGKSHVVQLYNHFPLNDKESFLHSDLKVKVGEKIKKGQLLADSNYTKSGTLSLGTNLQIAYLPYKGYNFNDGIVISESAAKKLSSQHVHRMTIELDPEQDIVDKKRFTTFAASSVKDLKPEQLAKIHDDGVIKVGQKVRSGDILVAAIGKPNYRQEDMDQIKRIDKRLLDYRSKSLAWESDHEGEVVKVVKHPNGKKITVFVKTLEAAQVGDKICGRHANKCFDPETELLTKAGWKKIPLIDTTDEILCMDQDTMRPVWSKPSALISYPHEGKMYKLVGPDIDLLVTPNHNNYVASVGAVRPILTPAEECVGKPLFHIAALGPIDVQPSPTFTIPGIPHEKCARYEDSAVLNVPSSDFAVFLAAWAARGELIGKDTIVLRLWDSAPAEHLGLIGGIIGSVTYKSVNKLVIRSPRVASFLADFSPAGFIYTPSRKPIEVLGILDTEAATAFLDTYLSAWEVNKPEWVDPVQQLGCMHGIPVTVHKAHGIAWAKPGLERIGAQAPGNEEGLVDYSGLVYCVEVPTHVVCARRNGKAVWSGNSIITRIVPDANMPRIGGVDGKPVEVLMNPSGIPTRINLGQKMETVAGKIAQKTGKPYTVTNFDSSIPDYSEKISEELKKHNISDTEPLFDPETKKKIGDILTGPQYILKLKHIVDHKLAYRGFGSDTAGYTLDHSPTGTGSAHPGQAVGSLELYALLAHGARHNLRDMATYKSDMQAGPNNDTQAHNAFWNRVMMNLPVPPPKVPFVYDKFHALLRGMGVDISKEGNTLQLVPWTDKGIKEVSHGELKDAGKVVRGKNVREIVNGLFDQKITGGVPKGAGMGLNWSHINLPEPVPNPVYVGTSQRPGPAVVLSGMKFNEFEQVARGKKFIDGVTGGPAIKAILDKVNVKEEIEAIKPELGKLRGQALDQANRKMKFLIALDQMKVKPSEVYLSKMIPVLPPVFRPLAVLPDGQLRPDDVNFHYKNIAHLSKELKDHPRDLPEESREKLRTQLYDAMKAYTGLPGGAPLYDSNRKVKGILELLRGAEDAQPKSGFIQKKMVKRRQDLSMRSTIVPEPSMHLDYIGLPKEAAFEIYRPFVVRELTKMGYNPGPANMEVKKRTDIALAALTKAMDERPVLVKRDPALHKYSFMAFKPKVVEGSAIKIHPLATGVYNADFDGDTMSAFVPFSEEAAHEAKKMFPSNHLFSSTHYGVLHTPEQEAIHGLHLLAKWGKPSNQKFKNYQDAVAAEKAGKIRADDVITMTNGYKTTVGRLMITEALPEAFRKDQKFQKLMSDPNFEFVAKPVNEHQIKPEVIFERIAKEHPKEFPVSVNKLMDLGNHYSYALGATVTMKDLKVNKQLRDSVLKKYDDEAAKVKASKIPQADKDVKVVDIYTKANEELQKKMGEHLLKTNNNYWSWFRSGGRGKLVQVMQLTTAPMLVQDAQGRTVPHPIKRSFAEGLDIGDYWTSMHGARSGTIQRVESTAAPGAMTKDIINTVMPVMIQSHDCGTDQGISLPVSHDDVHDRFLAVDTKVGKTTFKAGSVVDPHMLSELKKNKIDQVVVRSPLKCKHGSGICAKCFGLNENGKLHDPGVNIGTIAGHAIGEPMTQLAMDAFHTGGTAAGRGAKSWSKFDRMKNVLLMPKVVPDPAVLATHSGKVEKIEKDTALGGHFIWVDGQKHVVPPGKTLIHNDKPLTVGSTVRKGDSLTDGVVNPHTLLHLTDIHRVQNHVVNDLYENVFKDEGVKRRNIETVIRATTNLTKVTHPGDSSFLPGDIAQRTMVEEYNKTLKPGQKPVEHAPLLRHLTQTALDQHEDWLARLNYRLQKATLLEGVSRRWKTDIHGVHPIPAFIHGSEFGKGTKDKPHNW